MGFKVAWCHAPAGGKGLASVREVMFIVGVSSVSEPARPEMVTARLHAR